MSIKELWVEKYRPKTVEEYVFRDSYLRDQVNSWIKDGAIPHLLLSGIAGIGKTSLAKLILRQLNVPRDDILEIDASKDNSVDTMRTDITSFVGQMPFGDFRYVLLDEADYLSRDAQGTLRGSMEKYSASSRFILTCNYIHRIIPAIQSRCQHFHLEKLNKDDFDIRIATILVSENIECDADTLDSFVAATYPDLRKCINMLQQNSVNGVLQKPSKSDSGGGDYKFEMVELFKQRKIKEARVLVCTKARPEEFDDIYKFLYQNLPLFGNEQKQEEAILIIRKGLVNHTICADPEINLAATMIELSRL